MGDELAQICILADAIESLLHRAQEETEQDTQALKQVKEVDIEQ
jgi:copper homeostasis protein CutC